MSADVAVVLGYALEPSGVPTRPLRARVELGVRLFCSGVAKNIIFSGAAGEDSAVRATEADAMRTLAVALMADKTSFVDAAKKASEDSRWTASASSTLHGQSAAAAGGSGVRSQWRCPVTIPNPRPIVGTACTQRADKTGASLRVREMPGTFTRVRGDGDDDRGRNEDGGHAGGEATVNFIKEEKYVEEGVEGPGVEPGLAFHWVLEESSTSSRENAMFSLEECIRRGWSDVLVVHPRPNTLNPKLQSPNPEP